MRATGITIFSAIGGGIGGFIGNIGGGVLLEWISIFWLFRLMTVVSLAALVLAAVLKRLHNEISVNSKTINA
jgi:predicted MFS family arabinose efflux permease